MSTFGALEEGLHPAEPGQTAARVTGKNGEKATYPGNNKPVIPNIKGAKRAGPASTVTNAVELLGGVSGCINNLAGQ